MCGADDRGPHEQRVEPICRLSTAQYFGGKSDRCLETNVGLESGGVEGNVTRLHDAECYIHTTHIHRTRQWSYE